MTDHPVKRRKKQIEVAIPLEAIHAASARDVIFCQMVDDPSAVPEEFPTEKDQEIERLRLFALISTDRIGGERHRFWLSGPAEQRRQSPGQGRFTAGGLADQQVAAQRHDAALTLPPARHSRAQTKTDPALGVCGKTAWLAAVFPPDR